jgi:CCR4-NOT transcription complex subunit 7/8
VILTAYPETPPTKLFRYGSEDMYAPDVIDILSKANIDFARHEEMGIVSDDFAELLITSGLVLSDEVKWLAYAR